MSFDRRQRKATGRTGRQGPATNSAGQPLAPGKRTLIEATYGRRRGKGRGKSPLPKPEVSREAEQGDTSTASHDTGQVSDKLLQSMGTGLGADASRVSLRRGDEPAEAGAQALARGDEIVLATDAPSLESREGRELLGHELTHLVQQAQGRTPQIAQAKRGWVYDPRLEAEADAAGARLARGEVVRSGPPISLRGGGIGPPQPKLLKLPPSDDSERPWEVNTRGDDIDKQNLMRWIDAMRDRRPEAVQKLIRELKEISEPDEFEVALLERAQKAASDPRVGLPGVSYSGPTRPRLNATPEPEDRIAEMHPRRKESVEGKPVHRGVSEIEYAEIDGRSVPCARLYLTIVSAQNLSGVDEVKGTATSGYKDVQQRNGRIIISTGPDGGESIYINVGRPLRALKWADKYIAEHQAKGTGLDNPVIRSFLVPLDKLDEILSEAANQEDKNALGAGVENSDQRHAPNQYGFDQAATGRLRDSAVSGSLVSYEENPAQHPPEESGASRPMRQLRERLGVPERRLDKPMWISGATAREHSVQGKMAAELNAHYGTWIQALTGQDEPPTNAHIEGTKVPYDTRLTRLRNFLAGENIAADNLSAPAVQAFMKDVASWASLGAATQLLGEDYERLKDDSEVSSTSDPATNAFGDRREHLGEIRQHQSATGEAIDQLVTSALAPEPQMTPGQAATAILDTMVERHPELRRFYAETSNPSQGYRFYEHAQLVLEKYLTIVRLQGQRERSTPPTTVVEMIVFHDMHKWSSRWQYGKGRLRDRRNAMEEGDAEHVLPSETMSRYRDLWGPDAERQHRIARAMVDGDPFGDYLKGEASDDKRDAAFLAIVAMARRAGIDEPSWPAFYWDQHAFYQADFSSYTGTGSYVHWADRGTDGRTDSQRALDGEFQIENDELRIAESGDRFAYNEEKEKRLARLSAMFESIDTIRENLARIEAAREQPRRSQREKDSESDPVEEIDLEGLFS